MRPMNSADERNSCHLSPITCHYPITSHYVRYALIRCLVFTNEQADAERIAACALAKACLLSRRLGGLADPGLIVELMLGMVTSDRKQVRRGGSDKGQVIRGRSDKEHVIRDKRGEGRDVSEACLFVLNASMREVAGAINGMRRLARDLLVLHYIEGLSPAGLGAVHRMPPARVEAALAEARREFVEVLGGLSEWVDEPEPDVRAVLTQLARVPG